MTRSTTSKSKKETPWWVKDVVMPLIIAIISLLPYFDGNNLGKNFENKSTELVQPSTQNNVDSGTLNNVQNSKDVFINSQQGQQNNNTGSVEQTIINK